jgi:hypothetical protein
MEMPASDPRVLFVLLALLLPGASLAVDARAAGETDAPPPSMAPEASPVTTPPPPPSPPAHRRPRLLGEMGLQLGGSDTPVMGWTSRLSWRPGPLVVGVSLDYAAFPELRIAGRQTENAFFLATAGPAIPVGGRWQVLALVLAGAHVVSTIDFDAPPGPGDGADHTLPTVGARLGVELDSPMGSSRWYLSMGASITALLDLRHAYDPVLGREVGWPTVLLSAFVGLGL